MSEPEIVGFDPRSAPQSTNLVTPLPGLIRKRSMLQRQLRQVERHIEWLERKQARAEFVAADIVNAGRTDIPTLAEVVEWDVHFKTEYRAKHQARNDAILASTCKLEEIPGAAIEGTMREVAEDPLALLAEDANIQALDNAIDTYFEDLATIRGAGFVAADPLAGINEPKLSLLTCPPQYAETKLAWWVGAYQRIGLL